MVPVDGTGTASVAPVMALPVPGMQKPPRRIGKRFWDRLVVAPEGKVKKPEGLKQDPLGCGRTTWVRTRWSAAATQTARRGSRSRASLEAADGDDLVPGPNSDGEGAGSAAQDGIGAVVERLKGRDDTAPMDPEEGGRQELVWQLGSRIVPGQRNSRNMQGF